MFKNKKPIDETILAAMIIGIIVALALAASSSIFASMEELFLVLALSFIVITIAGIFGIIGASFNMWLFGIGCGLAAASVKILPFAIPLKNKDSKIDSLRVSPQAAAKSVGGAVFYLALAAIIKTAGFTTFTALASATFGLFG